uniref:Bestrophin homolog n=1 Tax=Branchiostoma floridae TaxID=7739 RepID=C3ZDH0_BRAFL|eukprot:XP_002592765.1 hypothetical protein BRAFLDRAFT_65345 [Branchiostoma floridae]
MTTSYSLKVADARFGGFVRLLFRWRASFYKLLYKELLVYLVLYFVLSATYRIVLNGRQREYFEDISLFCNKHTDLIPVAFLLGFYVSVVFTRWWQQYTCIPWPDRIAALIGCSFMMPSELKDYDQLDSPHNKFWLPLNWFCNLVTKCRKEGRVEDPYTFRALIEESNNIRGSLAMLYSYDWISVPLVYTQVVTVAVYTFFVSCLMGRQWLDPGKGYTGHEVDLYFPIFTVLQFLFYMGWLKVAEQLINPFGQDDDDFETNWCIDRNLQISYLAVDDLYMTNPALERDIYWNQPDPELPYTEASISNRNMTEPFLGSTFDMRLNVQNMEFTNLHTVAEEPEDKQESSEGLENAPGPTIVVSEGEDSGKKLHGRNLIVLIPKNTSQM